jgi:CRP/FNR family cyclic AMP-dependent transcriptional regulator
MATADEAFALLGRVDLFAELSPTDLAPLAADLRPRRFAADAYIFREGDPGDHLFLIRRGEVKISRTTEAGSEVVFGMLGQGGAFGELAVLEDNGVRSADAQALVETECLLLPRRALVAFLHAHPPIMWRVVTQLSGRIRRKDDEYADLAFLDIPSRVARKLLELAATRGTPLESGTLIELPLSQRTLAGLVGASRENVNRALSRFASLGVLKVERGRITLMQLKELRRRSM